MPLTWNLIVAMGYPMIMVYKKDAKASHCSIKGPSKQDTEHDLSDMLSYDHGLQKDAETSCYPTKNPSEQGRNGDFSTICEEGETDTVQKS